MIFCLYIKKTNQKEEETRKMSRTMCDVSLKDIPGVAKSFNKKSTYAHSNNQKNLVIMLGDHIVNTNEMSKTTMDFYRAYMNNSHGERNKFNLRERLRLKHEQKHNSTK